MPRDPASYRDPAGHVHIRDGRVLRTVMPAGTDNYLALKKSGFLDTAAAKALLIEGVEIDPRLIEDEESGAAQLIEHPRLDFISYPYEWSFDGLKAAAIHTLDLHLEALRHGLTMSDASAYNIQFIGPNPIFIDYLSLIRYKEGQVWLGYRQFCEQFLNPLLLTAKTGVAFQPMYRGTLEGITSVDLSALLPFRAKLGLRTALHVVLQAKLQRGISAKRTSTAQGIQLSRTALSNNLKSVRSWVGGLEAGFSHTPWQDYERSAQYTEAERAAKHRFVAEAVMAASPALLWDLGCNSGEYSEVALQNGARRVIGFEPDSGALNAAFQRARVKNLDFLPLSVDVTNPSTSSGWRQQERRGFAERRNAQMVLCLALLHHLVLGKNLPLQQVVDWIVSLAPRGVLEFVPREDPMAQQLLALKPNIAPEYQLSTVRDVLAGRARITRSLTVTASGRVLFEYNVDG